MMNSDRPKIKIPMLPLDIAIELASIAIIILMWIHIIMMYGELPETIPSHFNASGQPDAYSNKQFLWFLPILATAIYIGLFILGRYPHLHNYTVNITEENALRQYRFSTTILRIVNFLCALMFAYINYQIIIGAQNNNSELGMGFVISVVAISILLPVFIIIYQQKLKKKS